MQKIPHEYVGLNHNYPLPAHPPENDEMDDSWRVRMGMPAPCSPNYPPRRSAEEATPNRRYDDVEDFSDVFGGPPRTLLSRQFSAQGYPAPSSTKFFYEEIFRPLEKTVSRENGRGLPQFSIHTDEQRRRALNRDFNGFYSDIFGWEDREQRVVRSRSRSKASSSSVISSEDITPLRPVAFYARDDSDYISFFASKLRPINVNSGWSSTRTGHEDNPPPNQQIHKSTNEGLENYHFRLNRRNASAETISLEPISNDSYRVSADYSELNSPSSAVSLVCPSDQEQKTENQSEDQEDENEQDEDEAMSSYVIEINSDNRERTCESNGVDEAIAWAKETFQTVHDFEKEQPTEEIFNKHQLSERHTVSIESMDEPQHDKWAAEEPTPQLESMMQTEMQILDEKIRLWSNGREGNIRLLLSSLHHILWSNSGWIAIPLTNIVDTSQVKKAYQKAQLCLHPDKLQQRGATVSQKYIAERAFSELQDAWTSFVSQDVLCR